MAKQLNVSLAFQADTSKAKQQIAELSKALQDIVKLPGKSDALFDDRQLNAAAKAAQELQHHLQAAVDVNTGKLDLSRFSTSIKSSGKNLNDYYNTLIKIGPQGQEAFLKIAKSVAMADAPVTRVNAKLKELGTTLANTARWQLSSSVLHGFMGAIQSAYGYAQDLNKSLNNIRIVTGYSKDEMADFAVQANKAAQALSTTTTDYTDAALIYYQQGIRDQSQIAERTATTIKLANVSRQSAEEVSQQMTAIWNNFYDGSKSLEYYADAITALGANTASSSEEIATGLEKFAAVSKTVGLSYEYATAALATITAQTRQSADTVGTGLRTLFARLESLKLGENLEDGVDLNKYSKALHDVGVEVLDTSGQMRQMDNILDDLAVRWNSLGQAQKMALAQTVGGVRQYTNLIALMDNWDKMQQNILTAQGSEGTLQEQADIYAESWEAASKRVKAAAESVYQDLLDDEFFIKLLNGFAKVIQGVESTIDHLGGLRGVLMMIGSIFTLHFAQKMPQILDNLKQNLMVLTGQGQKLMLQVQQTTANKAMEVRSDASTSEKTKIEAEGVARLTEMKKRLIIESKNLTETEKADYEERMKNVEAIYEEAAALGAEIDKLKQETQEKVNSISSEAGRSMVNQMQGLAEENINNETEISNLQAKAELTEEEGARLETLKERMAEVNSELQKLGKQAGLSTEEMNDLLQDGQLGMTGLQKVLQTTTRSVKSMSDRFVSLNKSRATIDQMSVGIKSQAKEWKELSKEIGQNKEQTDSLKTKMRSYLDIIQETGKNNGFETQTQELKELEAALQDPQVSAEVLAQKFEAFSTSLDPNMSSKIGELDAAILKTRQDLEGAGIGAETLDGLAQSTDQLTQKTNQLNQSRENGKRIADESIQSEFHMSTALTQFAGAAMSVYTVINSAKNAIATFGDEGASGIDKVGAALSLLMSITMAYNTVSALANTLSKTAIGTKLAEAVATKVKAVADGTETTGIGAKIIAKLAEIGVNYGLQASMLPILIITLAITAAILVLIGLILAITAAVKALSDAYNADAIAAENAENAAKNLAEAYNETKEAYEDLKSAVEDHENAIAAIEDMEKGTREWRDAIRDANDQAMELIDTLKLGRDAYNIDENGLIKFKDGVLEEKLQEESQKVASAEATSIMAQQMAREKRAQADLTDLKRDNHISVIGNMAAGAAVGSFLGPVGTYYGAIAGGIGAGIKNVESDKRIESAITRLTTGDLAKDFSTNSLTNEKLMEELNITDGELIDAIKELAETINYNTEMQETSSEMAARAVLEGNQEVQESGYADDMAKAAGRIYKDAYYDENTYNKYLNDAKSRGLFNTGNAASKEAMEKYAKAAGLDQLKNYKVTNYKGDGTVEYSYIDDEGKEQKKLVTAEEIAAKLAAAEAEEKLKDATDNLLNTFKSLDASGKDYDQAMKQFLASEDLGNTKKKEYDALTKQVGETGGAEAYLADQATKFGFENLEEYAHAMGYESAAAFTESFQKELNETSNQWRELDLSDVNLIGIDNVSLKTGKVIKETLDQINLGPEGEVAGQRFIEGMNKMLENVDPDDQQAALSALMNIDWSSWDALEQADQIMKQFGVDIDTSSDYWKEFAHNMQIATGAIPDFSHLRENLTSITALLSKLDFGKTISDEDYQKLVAYNDEWEKYFQLQADGTRKFIGNTEEMTKATQESIREQRKELVKRAEAQAGFENAGWGTADENGEWNKWKSEDWKAYAKNGGVGGAQNLMNAGGATQDMLEQLGYTDKIIENMIYKAEHGTEAQKEKALEAIREMYDRIGDFQDEDLQTLDQELDEMMASTATTLNQLLAIQDEISKEAFEKQKTALGKEALNDAQTIEEVMAVYQQFQDVLSPDAAAAKVNDLLPSIDDMDKLKQYFEEGIISAEQFTKAAIELDQALDLKDLDAEELNDYAKYLQEISDSSDDLVGSIHLSDELKENDRAAKIVAKSIQKMNLGVEALANNFEDWQDTLTKSTAGSEEYFEALRDLRNAASDLLDINEDFLSKDFLTSSENMKLFAKAAEGDAEAIDMLRQAALQDIVLHFELDDEELNQNLWNDIAVLQTQLDNMNLEVGATLEDENFMNTLNSIIESAGLTVDQVNAMFDAMGFEANFAKEEQPVEQKVPKTVTKTDVVGYTSGVAQQAGPDGTSIDVPWSYPILSQSTYNDGYSIETGVQEVMAMSTNGKTPQISGITKKATGSANNTSKSNPGSGGKSSKESKGSGSTPKKETKEKKNPTEEKERYHLINQQIERQSNILDRLGKSKDRVFGPQKQRWYTQELKSLKDMGKMYEEHLRQSEAYLANDTAVMKAWGAQISGKDNSILNYDDLVAKQVAAYNAAVDRYNASAQTDADKAAFQKAEEAYKKFQEDLKQYEDTVKQHEEDINNYIDNMIEQYDTMQAKTADAIEFRIEYDDSVLDFLDKLIDRLDSWNGSMFAAVDIMGKLNDKTGALIQKNKDLETATAETLEHFLMDYKEFDAQGNIIYQTGMSKADSDAFINRFNTGGLTSEDIEMLAHMPEEERQLLMDYAEQRQDNTDALIETAQAVVDDVERQFNDAKDELAEAAKPIASATAALDNYAAIIDIVGADYLGVTDDIMQQFRDQQWNVLHETTMSNKAIMESLAAQRDMIEQEMNNALANGNDELAEMYREKLKGINDEVQSATEEWYSSWQAELSKLEEDFEKHIDEIKTKALDLAAGDAGTWQSLKDTMDYAQQAAERFLPEYKEIYEFSKLNRDINKSIDDTDNIKNKQALKKLQDEINKLQEKSGQISQYDLDNARRRYELELARLALEESRNAKEVVRLSKDSEGNWSYIYTASEEDVADAEQNYEDKLFAMQQANADYINDLQGQLTQATEDYYNKVAEINLIYKDDDEKRREELEKARMQYEETMQYYGGELQKAMDNNKQLYDEDWAWYSDYTQKINDDQGYRLGELENYVTEFDDTMLGMATGYDSVAAFEDDLLDHSIDTLGQMDEAYEHWSEQIHFSMEEAGTSVEYFAEDMMEQVDHVIVPKAEEARDSVEDLGETVVDIMGEMVDAAGQWRQTYSAAIDAIIAKNDAVKQSIQQVISALSALKTAQIGHDTTTGRAPEGAGQAGPTTSSPTRTTPSTGAGSTSGTGTSGSSTSTTKTPPHVVETGYRYQTDETCMGYTKYSDGTETHNAGGHNKQFDHYEGNDAKYICTKCKHMWTVKNARKAGSGCFAAGTKIMLPTRELKNIEEIQLGEEILAYNIETELFESKVVNMIYFKRGYNEMADIELSNGQILTMTLGHPLLTTQGWKSLDLENSEFEHGVSDATLLSVGDILIGYDKPVMVNNINIYPVDKDYIVYCLGVDGYHNFIANDIIVHNALYAQITKFATGGYTGDSGNPNEGKLAVLHNKELVLNKDDTEHILNAVDMVRSISKTIDAYAMTNQFTIGNLTAARGVNPINGQMEQSVTITAEFPNATDRNEIAEAFNTLINQASQYANRKY